MLRYDSRPDAADPCRDAAGLPEKYISLPLSLWTVALPDQFNDPPCA
jgi:hypothetical protein